MNLSGDGNSLQSEDAMLLWDAAGRPLDLQAVCPQRFEAAVAPDEAARREGKRIDEDLLLRAADKWRDACQTLVVEGAGGMVSPIADGFLNVDFALRLAADETYLVAANRLGVIHDLIASCRAARASGLAIDRVYLSSPQCGGDESVRSNADQIRTLLPEMSIFLVEFGARPVPYSSS